MNYTRREMLKLTGGVIAASAVPRSLSFAASGDPITHGLVAGQVKAAPGLYKLLPRI